MSKNKGKGLRENAPRIVYKQDFTQQDWMELMEELENQPPPQPPKLTFYSADALNNWYQIIKEYLNKQNKP